MQQCCPNSIKRLLKNRRRCRIKHFKEITEYYSCWEWFNEDKLMKDIPIRDVSKWRFIDMGKLIKKSFPQRYWMLNTTELLAEIRKRLDLRWKMQCRKKTTTSTFEMLSSLFSTSRSPIVVATDGAYNKPKDAVHNTQHITTSAFVICEIDGFNHISKKGTIAWENKPKIPILCRMKKCPSSMGAINSDIATGEAAAFALQ